MLSYCLDIEPRSRWIITTKTEAAKEMPFYLTEYGDFYSKSGYYTERDNKEGYQLLYTLSGSGKLRTAFGEVPLLPGSAVIVKCFSLHRYETDEAPWHCQWIHFGGLGADHYEQYINDERIHVIQLPAEESFGAHFDSLSVLAPRNDLISIANISNEISEMLTCLLTHRISSTLQFGLPATHYTDIHNALLYIQKNFKQPITIDDITAHIKMSKYHFIRLFKRQMGITPYAYLINYRINQAKILLQTTTQSLFDISYAVGYKSKSNFVAQFKSIVGVTPAKYRAESLTLRGENNQTI